MYTFWISPIRTAISFFRFDHPKKYLMMVVNVHVMRSCPTGWCAE